MQIGSYLCIRNEICNENWYSKNVGKEPCIGLRSENSDSHSVQCTRRRGGAETAAGLFTKARSLEIIGNKELTRHDRIWQNA
jgi:hypothetical protein